MNQKSVSITITGTVQGVGFRPFIVRTATRLGISGSVCNTSDGVLIEAHGTETVLQDLVECIRNDSPILAVINKITVLPMKYKSETGDFTVIDSIPGNKPTVEITKDTAVCSKCLSEMRSSLDRRFDHTFVNCTECGPRYSIIEKVPYDREFTSMKNFPMCPVCSKEFNDTSDRRFHAQPVCCPSCGPELVFLDSKGATLFHENIIYAAKELLQTGKIIAIKGLGGFHLACRADNPALINRLRFHKLRMQKPFACMVRDIESAAKYADMSKEDKNLLTSPGSPIVLVKKNKSYNQILSSVAPGLSEIGLMLPYTPVHHLLFDNAPYDLLVMTSANNNGEPMCIDESEIVVSVGDTVDAILTHNRSIVVRLDDSVIRPMKNGPVLLRRGRGYVPSSFKAPFNVDGTIGLGAQMKNSITIGRENNCFVSEYMGTTDSAAVIDECGKTLQRLLGILDIKPRLVAADIHPSGLSEYYTKSGIPFVTVQHHHAHAAACMGENNLTGKTICVVYDGTGLGEDGSIWGSEILIADYTTYTRAGHLNVMPLVGNDAAIEYPGRMAIAICAQTTVRQIEKIIPWISSDECNAVVSLISKPSFTTPTTSMGRLFDSCAAVLDICRKRTYEGQPAIELEAVADIYCKEYYPVELLSIDGQIIMDGQTLLLSVIEDRDNGIAVSIIAARFHNTVAKMTIDSVKKIAENTGIRQVALSGGCFCNKLLFERIFDGLIEFGLQVYSHHGLPPGDENISYGQVLIAASPPAPLREERRGEHDFGLTPGPSP